MGGLNLFAFVTNTVEGIVFNLQPTFPLTLLNGVIAFACSWLVVGYIKKIRRLKKEKQLHE